MNLVITYFTCLECTPVEPWQEWELAVDEDNNHECPHCREIAQEVVPCWHCEKFYLPECFQFSNNELCDDCREEGVTGLCPAV